MSPSTRARFGEGQSLPWKRCAKLRPRYSRDRERPGPRLLRCPGRRYTGWTAVDPFLTFGLAYEIRDACSARFFRMRLTGRGPSPRHALALVAKRTSGV